MQSLTSASNTIEQADDSASALGDEDAEPPSKPKQSQANKSKPKTAQRNPPKTRWRRRLHFKNISKAFLPRLFMRSESRLLRRSLLSVLETTPPAFRQRALNDIERDIVENLLRHRDRAVEDHMVPRSEIFALPATTTRAQALVAMRTAGHSRVPVFEESLDNTKGYLHLKDLIGLGETNGRDRAQDSIRALLRTVIFTSPAINNLDLLRQMRTRRTHLALIVDEHGGVDGLVTIEDLIEEFFGEIEDEHDVKSGLPKPQKRADGGLSVDARFRLEDLPEALYQGLRADAEAEDIDTVGGFAAWMAGQVPKQGETLIHEPSGLQFYINAAGRRRVTHLTIAPPQ